MRYKAEPAKKTDRIHHHKKSSLRHIEMHEFEREELDSVELESLDSKVWNSALNLIQEAMNYSNSIREVRLKVHRRGAPSRTEKNSISDIAASTRRSPGAIASRRLPSDSISRQSLGLKFRV